MLSQTNLAAILQRQQVANNATIRDKTICDNSYHYEYNHFKAWVIAQLELRTPMPPFLSRANVDNYFSRVIAHRIVCPNTARRVMNALDWYGTHREHVGADPAFACKSPLVETALRVQKIYNKLHGGTAKPGGDPHMGLNRFPGKVYLCNGRFFQTAKKEQLQT
jgi:hypothetical protein